MSVVVVEIFCGRVEGDVHSSRSDQIVSVVVVTVAKETVGLTSSIAGHYRIDHQRSHSNGGSNYPS